MTFRRVARETCVVCAFCVGYGEWSIRSYPRILVREACEDRIEIVDSQEGAARG